MHACMSAYMWETRKCVCICVYIFIFIRTHIYIYTYTGPSWEQKFPPLPEIKENSVVAEEKRVLQEKRSFWFCAKIASAD